MATPTNHDNVIVSLEIEGMIESNTIKTEIKEVVEDVKDEIKDVVEDVKDEIKDVVEDVKDEIKDVVEDVKDEIKEETNRSEVSIISSEKEKVIKIKGCCVIS